MSEVARLADDFADLGLTVLSICADETEIDHAHAIATRVAPGHEAMSIPQVWRNIAMKSSVYLRFGSSTPLDMLWLADKARPTGMQLGHATQLCAISDWRERNPPPGYR